LHVPSRNAVETANGVALYRGKQAALAIRAFAPDQCDISVRTGHIPYPEFAARTPAVVPAEPGYLDISTEPVSATNFLTALIPSRTGESARALAGSMTEIKDNTWLGIRTSRANEADLILFRIAGSIGEASYGRWLTDADSWTVTSSGERVNVLSAHSVRVVSRSGRKFFSSDRPASFAAHFEGSAVVVTISITADSQIRIATGTAPTKVRLDGRELPASAVHFSGADQMSQMTIGPGQHEIVFTLR
jgi:hypothetical protein